MATQRHCISPPLRLQPFDAHPSHPCSLGWGLYQRFQRFRVISFSLRALSCMLGARSPLQNECSDAPTTKGASASAQYVPLSFPRNHRRRCHAWALMQLVVAMSIDSCRNGRDWQGTVNGSQEGRSDANWDGTRGRYRCLREDKRRERQDTDYVRLCPPCRPAVISDFRTRGQSAGRARLHFGSIR